MHLLTQVVVEVVLLVQVQTAPAMVVRVLSLLDILILFQPEL
jgi:hypothetical protein